MKHLKDKSPVQQVFILVFVIMVFYHLITKLPFLPDMVFGLAFTKIMKIISGLIFSLGALLIYTLHKKANHGSGY